MNLWNNMKFLVIFVLALELVKGHGNGDQSRIRFPDEDFSPQSRSSGYQYDVKFSPQSGVKTSHGNYGFNDNRRDDFQIEDVSNEDVMSSEKFHPVWFPHPGNPNPGNPHFHPSHPHGGHPGNPQPGHPHQGRPHPGNPHPGNPHPGHPHQGHPHPGHPYGKPLNLPSYGGHPGYGSIKTSQQSVPDAFPSYGGSYQPGIKTSGVKTVGIKTTGVKTTSQTHVETLPHYDTKQETENFLLEAQRMPPIGGCISYKKLPANSNVKCQDVTGTCRVTCLKGYKFPTGASSLQISCVNNNWVIKDSEWFEIPSCEPICMPSCQNNGICIAPGICKCPQNFHGVLCQNKKVFCPSYPPVPNNSNMSCNPSQCTIQCLKGYKFSDGSQITNMVCEDGQWKHTKSGRTSPPECEPICDPPCQNGGTCQGYNSCLCLKKFRGPQCQYDGRICNITETGFNGQYSCTFKANEAICMVSCPPSIRFDSPPADKYICEYSSNFFKPGRIPLCIYPPGFTVIRGPEYSTNTSHSGIKSSFQYGQQKHQTTVIEELPAATFTSETDGVYSLYVSSNLIMKSPAPAMCATWGGRNVKTFDGLIYKVPLHCSHTLVQDSVDGTFNVVLKLCPSGQVQQCHNSLQIYFNDVLYTFQNEDGVVSLNTPKKKLPIPVQILGMKVIPVANLIKIDLDKIGVVVYWDKDQYALIETNANWWERTSGLCGTLDMDPRNDLTSKSGRLIKSLKTFVDDWEVKLAGEKDQCKMSSVVEFEKPVCEYLAGKRGKEVCTRLLSAAKLKECVKQLDEKTLFASCMDDYCKCTNSGDRNSCVCDTVSMLAKDCIFKGIKLDHGWRDLEICPVNCEKGRVYSPCGPSLEPTCGFVTSPLKDTCREGCYCPEGTVQYKGDCILPEQCPCAIRNKEFKSGSKITKDCNTCTCEGGIWNCSDITCGARCGAIGDPHYMTFDGKQYDFMGKCSYYLLKTGDLSVEAENVACPGSISAAMNLAPSTSSELPSCTKSVTIRLPLNGKDTTIKLAQGPVVYVNDREVENYPKTLGNDLLVIRQPSSTFVSVDFADGIRIWWDGNTRVYIDAPASFRNKTQGLCGTFNSNTMDDFLTPEGDIETAIEPFADKWRTKDTCDFLSDAPSTPYPCDTYPENRPKAEKYCDYILSEIYEECHWSVDPEPFYENCMYDVCACKGDIPACMCPILAAYGTECSRQGVNTNWRFSIKECSLECPAGQVYDECGDSCLRTCQDISRKELCKGHCVEGCRCPRGEYLNDNNECIPAEKCPCWYDGMSFEPGYKEVRPGEEFLELCTCLGGNWECAEATKDDKEHYPPSGALKSKCLEEPNSEFTKCVPNEPKTCKNMHKYVETFEDCIPGCVCKIGYVLDTFLGKCVVPEDCSCHHGGRSYNDGDDIKEDCNTCKCKSGKWECTKEVCASTCSVWGDSHFTTFDNKDFDFQGACDYVLSKGVNANGDGFTIAIQNVLCGSLGVTCSKSVKITLSGKSQDSVKLSSDPTDQKSIEKYKKVENENPNTFTTYNAGVFLVVEVPDLGLQVKWDYGTRVYIKLSDKWKRKVSGLCGNYNDDAQDDMKTPSMGVETSPLMFGHSWKLQDYCSIPTEPINACKEHSERESWAHIKCGILKSSIFKDCHSAVPYEKYLKRCVFDTCACDQGGDCECLCTALAAYAFACSMKGVEIKWRTPHLCPMQCDPNCSEYRPCTQPCPVETCDNFLEQGIGERMCLAETCFEGCHIKPCEEGMIYLNDSFSNCVPKSTCKPICMEKDGVVYYEGDITRSDDCQTCRCTRKKEICSGAPCTTPITLMSTTHSVPVFDSTEKPLDICDPTIPHHEFPGDCYKFLHCMQQPSGVWTFVEKTCGPSMMYNPISMTCDHIYAVEALKPECLLPKKTSPTPSTHEALIAEKCAVNGPLAESPRDCYKYLQCVEITPNTWSYVEKLCPNGKMFNPLVKECDNTASVLAIKPICSPSHPTTETPTLCPPGQKWSECAIHCEKSCHFYKNILLKKGVCNQGDTCEAGCIDINAMQDCALAGKVWRDEHSCVMENECPCISPDGKLIKPHDIYESVDDGESKLCQCLDNTLICIPEKPVTVAPVEAAKPTTERPQLITTSTEKPLIIPTTVTPPKRCAEKDLVPMISGPYGLPDSAFAASSVLGSAFLPQYARLHSKPSARSNGSWSPGTTDQMEYLQITFPQPTPLYGVVLQGSPIFDQYVTSFKILYIFDGSILHYVTNEDGTPQIFNGPVSARKTESSFFKTPIEAKVVRIYPLKWHGSISIRVELYGCSPTMTTMEETRSTPAYYPSTTSTPLFEAQISLKPTEAWPGITQPVEPVCTDEMGVDNGHLNPSQVKTSSVLWPKPVKGKKPRLYDMLKMSSPVAWRPAVNTPNQYVLFDFLEPRNVTGVKTKGGPDGWVTSYKVMFSKNGKMWNKVITPDGALQVFDGNRDSDTPKTNYFQYPIQAQFIKLVPIEWHDTINMRIEPIGCFHPYEEITVSPEEESICPICPDVEINTLPTDKSCKCKIPLYWDGKGCVDRNMCPCVVNYVSYQIGSAYENENCEKCVCVLGGTSQCTEKKCPPCTDGLRKDKSKPCTCACEPCPPFQRICPSTGDCIPEVLWCNGYQDCEDDEKDCVKEHTTPTPVLPKEELYVNKTCPEPACPEGMQVELTGNSREREMSQMFETTFVAVKSNNAGRKGGIPSQMFVDVPEQDIETLPALKCPEYICVFAQKNKSESCPLAQCQEGYEVEYEKPKEAKLSECNPYACVPVRQKDAICKVTGKTFETFDGTEFKFDACNHVIVRDLQGKNWAVVLNVNCSNYVSCRREVIIKDVINDFALKLLPDLTVNLNGFDYTVRQLEKTSFQFGFIISQPGSTILFVSKKHGFWVSYDESGDVKIGVSSQYINTVDGLCGYYNDNPDDDKRLPNGRQAKNTAEFGKAWFTKEVPNEYCQPQLCTENAEAALKICNSVKHKVFSSCSKAVDYDGFLSKCVEATCECLKGENSGTTEKASSCKCLALERFAKKCRTVKPDVHLDTWRAIHDCEITCPPPLIYKECYKRRCEPSCDTIGNECPLLPDECYSGCFCPDGTVRKGETCVSVTECKDCICDGIGKSKYVTYDRKNFTFDGNCTYLLSRDITLPGTNTFQVYTTLGPCEDANTKNKWTKSSCAQSLHILYGTHIIHLQRLPNKSVQILVDGLTIKTLPLKNQWLQLSKVGVDTIINLPDSQVEVASNFADNTFSIRVPSIKYGSKLEGLCGDCNGNPDDDIKANTKFPKPVKGNSTADIAETWQADEPKLGLGKEECVTDDIMLNDCLVPDPEVDPCLKIFDDKLFGKCHFIVDPVMYISGCQQDMCKHGPDQKGACESLAAYAKECARKGICVDWRKSDICPYECPPNMEYKPCGCLRTCESVKQDEIFAVIDIRSNAVMDDDDKDDFSCSTERFEGCFCPKGKVLNNDKCIAENECNLCDDHDHYQGDVWYKDKCTECTCNKQGNVECTKRECSVQESVCGEGYYALKISSEEECCPKFICVPEPTLPPAITCPDAPLLSCGPGQNRKLLTGKTGCPEFVCECKPLSECEPLTTNKPLKPGEKLITETIGCCPSQKIVCDKLQCPSKPKKCDNELYDLIKDTKEDECCPIYKCAPPKNTCLVTINGVQTLKRFGDKWSIPTDPCVQKICSYGPEGVLLELEQQEICDINCERGFKYTVDPGKCCGKCVQAMCILGDQLYKPGEIWYSEDNCTKFTCELRGKSLSISSYEETCPDISNCPVKFRYKKGCCELCNPIPESQVTCLPESLAESETVKTVQVYQPMHGLCINKEPIRGFTECHGSCRSGSKFNKLSYGQDKICECCSIQGYQEMKVPLTCKDGYKIFKSVQIPASCGCEPCDGQHTSAKMTSGVKTVKG